MTIKQQVLELNRIGNDIINTAITLSKRAKDSKTETELQEGNTHTTFWIAVIDKEIQATLSIINNKKLTGNE